LEKKLKVKKIKVPLFSGFIMAFIGGREDFLDHMFNKYGADLTGSADTTTHGLCFNLTNPNGESLTGIWVDKGTPFPVLAHECLHATYFTLDFFGVSSSVNDNETQAYLLQYYIEEISKLL